MTAPAAPQTKNTNIDKLLLVGCGKMGSAMLEGWLAKNIVSQCHVIDLNDAHVPQNERISFSQNTDSMAGKFTPDIIVLATKPQIMDQVVPTYKQFVSPQTTFLSIAAGKSIGYFEKHLSGQAKIVRAMPNTPAAVGEGITVLCANTNIEEADKPSIGALLSTIGKTVWVEDEALMDAVTAVSGSGPAYIFLLIEAMAQAGIKAGLPTDLAMQLARQTVIGSAALAKSDASVSAEQLRVNVTSPGGTTAAALEVLMRRPNGIQELFDEAITAATRRSVELSD